MIWNFHVFLPLSDVLACIPITSDVLKCIPITSDVLTLYNCHSLVSWNVLLQFAQVLECIATTSRSLSLCVFQWIATFWHFGRYNYYFLTFFGNVFLPHSLLWECITITHWCFGIYYYHFLTFWNVLVYCHFLVFLESISTNFDVLEYTIHFRVLWRIGTIFLRFEMRFYHFMITTTVFEWIATLSFWDVHLSLTTFWNLLLNVLLPLSKVLEFITIGAFWCFGMYYNFLTFWNVLLQLSDVLECITTF